jgi:hypothetical protein
MVCPAGSEGSRGNGRPWGVSALGVFFGAGAMIAGASALALAFPGSWLDPMWRLNPEARAGLAKLGSGAAVLMLIVAVACTAAAAGLWTGRRWGHRLAIGVLGCNLVGDLLNAVLRGDFRALIGLPIGGAMIAYLLSRRIQARFEPQLLVTDRLEQS